MHGTERRSAGGVQAHETGTTTVGVAAADGVAMATDRRASLGGRVVTNKSVRKVEQVHPTAALTFSGTVGGAQLFLRQLRAEVDLYAARRGEPPSVDALSTLAGDLLRGLPVTPLLGGVDPSPGGGGGDAPRLFQLDGGGGVMEDRYAAAGSGMQVAYGVLERQYGSDLSLDEAAGIAADAVAAASERDTASGNGVVVAEVTGEGVDVREAADAEGV